VTAAARSAVAALLPAALVAVTTTRTGEPTSAEQSWQAWPVAPGTSLHANATAQRCH
jgi:hypothetical protein